LVLQPLRRKTLSSVFVLWLAIVSVAFPPQTWAGPVDETNGVALAPATPSAKRPDNGIAYVLQPEDDALQIAEGLIDTARRLRTNVVRLHVVRGEKDDPRLLTILRELEFARLDIQASILDLNQAEEEIARVSEIRVSADQLRRVIAEEEARSKEGADYGNSVFARVLASPGKVVSLGEALLGMPWRLFRWGMTKLTGQRFRPLMSFVIEPTPGNADGAQITVSKSWIKNAFYTAVLAVVMIWGNTFLMGPWFSDSPEFQFSQLSERGYRNLIQVSYNVFLWVFLSLAIVGPITAWKDQIVRIRYDEKAPEGSQVRVEPNNFVNFGLALLLETLFNVMLPAFNGTLNAIKDGTAWTWENLREFFWGQVWVPVTALFSVFSFAVPQNLFGRWMNRADVLERSPHLEDRQRGARYRLYAGFGSFVFWTFLFSTAVNLARFLPKDRPLTAYFPESLSWMNEFLRWVPASAAPLLALGGIGFGWQYGGRILRGVRDGITNAVGWVTGKRAPAPKRQGKSCAIFLVEPPDAMEPAL
jgi:hypothetical protein